MFGVPGEHVETQIPAFQSGCPTPGANLANSSITAIAAHEIPTSLQDARHELPTEMVPMLSPEMIWWNTSLWSAPTFGAAHGHIACWVLCNHYVDYFAMNFRLARN